ncbi:hypothetical protein LFL96_27645 [Paraburkholderia sp. D15]|uniref:hypothetical protein n=1 Tax=Paraburkholderia sp. D15 TaxID=2880218 RepID=UPI0024796343|nr:hypothetical protein [Paraburkholderia sp. D15]WGS51984.1 hypothetical protein LFL96_27645 [Paraburkholderia sp. D15]
MALTQTIDSFAQQPQSFNAPQVHKRNNVIPFPSGRVRLQVGLPHLPHHPSGTQLRALLHSPLGVYVVSTETGREEDSVQLDIAYDDLDFTLHTLISTLPAALIGPVKRRNAAARGR